LPTTESIEESFTRFILDFDSPKSLHSPIDYGDRIMAILTVTTTADNGTGSLREALQLAQSGDTIQFDPSLANSQITLTSGQLEINKTLTVDGANAPGLTISGNNQSRIFFTTHNVDYNPIDVTLRNLILADGKTSEIGEPGSGGAIRTIGQTNLIVENSEFRNNVAAGEGGGAIFSGWRSKTTVVNSKFDNNNGVSLSADGVASERGGGAIAVKSESELIVRDSEFTNNKGINGGAINNLLSKLTVENSTFLNNDSTPGGPFGTPETNYTRGFGGAIYVDGASNHQDASTAGTIQVSNSRFEGNKGAGQGGGLFIYLYNDDNAIVEGSTIVNNSVIEDSRGSSYGGGLRHGNGALTIRDTTFANNSALSQGGGLWLGERSPVDIVNSTFSGNRAANADGSDGLGGALTVNTDDGYAINLVNTTLANNYAARVGGAVFSDSQPITVQNSIFGDNSAGNPNNIYQHTYRQLLDGGNNIQYPPKNPSNPDDANITANVTLVDPQLGALQELNGALVHPLLAGSAAIDAGGSVTGLTTDQLGVARSDGQIDIGSFEFVGPTITPDNSDSLSGTFGDDSLFGGSADQRIIAHKGNDYIDGGEGNDLIYGHADNDTLFGSGGSDSLYGGWHEDMLFGGSGNDLVYADQGNDIIEGNDGDDELFGQPGDDRLTGGTGNDNLYGGLGNDVLNGVDPNAAAPGTNEQDLLSGGGNSDTFVLGDATRVYYDDRDPSTDGSTDLATIADFNKLEDRIQLHGSAASYQLGEVTTGTGIYYTSGQTSPELVAVVRDVPSSELNLNDSYFTYV
jgi:Ca2+-binding RTX toxin-like protein